MQNKMKWDTQLIQLLSSSPFFTFINICQKYLWNAHESLPYCP